MVDEEPKNWHDLLKKVEYEKRNCPPEKIVFHNISKDKITQPSLINPVRMMYTDDAMEERLISIEREVEHNRIERIVKSRNSKFNPITHEGPPRKQLPSKRLQNSREWNLLSQVNHNDHGKLSIFYDESVLEKQKKAKREVFQSGLPPRTFNILNNEFITNNEELKKEEFNNMKSHIKKFFWETHDFNLVRGEYYDIKKDERMKEYDQKLIQSKSQRQLTSFPHSVMSSEGRNYNILSLEEYTNKPSMVRPNSNTMKREKSIEKIRNTREKYNNYASGRENKFRADAERYLNRISIARWDAELKRDHDIVTNAESKKHLPRINIPNSILKSIQGLNQVPSSFKSVNSKNIYIPRLLLTDS